MKNDRLINLLLKQGRLQVDCSTGLVYSRSGRKLGSKTNKGYIRIKIMYRRKQRIIRAHRVVYICIWGLLGYGMEVDHIDGVKDNNFPLNLESVTGATNSQRANANGQCNHSNKHDDRGSDGKFKKAAEKEMEKLPPSPF